MDQRMSPAAMAKSFGRLPLSLGGGGGGSEKNRPVLPGLPAFPPLDKEPEPTPRKRRLGGASTVNQLIDDNGTLPRRQITPKFLEYK